MTEEPYRWLEAVANRREYVHEQLKSGTPVLAASLPDLGQAQVELTALKHEAEATWRAERVENALKIIGDAYYARLYRGAAGRLGLKDWQLQIDSKLQSINEMYRFFTDQAQAARSEFLEAVVIFLIGVEIVVGVLALHH